MKKILTFAVILGLSSIAYADHKINFSTANLTCGNYKITASSTAAELSANCKVTEQEIKFRADNGSQIECKFKDNKLSKCELED